MKIRLTVIAGPHQGRSFEFEEHDTFLVGRARYAHFRLPGADQHLSRAHFLVEANPPWCRIMDMASTNGTFLNGRRIDESPLTNGDIIEAGDASIEVVIDDAEDPRATRRAVESRDEKTLGRETDFVVPSLTELDQQFGQKPSGESDELELPGYQFLHELGRGGMGTVFLAERESDGSPVAIKIIRPMVPIGPVDLQKFLREAAILMRLSHPHIVRCFDCVPHNGAVYLVMESVPGQDAGATLQDRGPFDVRTAVGIICQILEALEFAHQAGFVHRDIKPSNILLTQRGGEVHAKLADFGLARVYQSSKLSGLTMHGEFGGSLPFLPPEQITGFRDVDPRADLYSTSATLYTLLCGRYIHDFAESVNKRILQVLESPPVPLEQRREDLPPSLVRLIHRGLARNPADRFSTAAQFRRALLPLS